MNPEWAKWIQEGEIVVLVLLGGFMMLMFRHFTERCEKMRSKCNEHILERLKSFEEKVDLKLQNVIDKQQLSHEILTKILNGERKGKE